MKGIVLIVLQFLVVSIGYEVSGQNGVVHTMNDNWLFFRGDTLSSGQYVSVPHSWNTEDVSDDVPGYYRGKGWYKKQLFTQANWKDKQVFLCFEGANQVTKLYVNNRYVGTHTGGYTAFHFNITGFLRYGDGGEAANTIAVEVDNSHSELIPPLSADFTFFGGIYRDVQLMITGPVHVGMGQHGEQEVFVSTPEVSAASASLVVSAVVDNQTASVKKVKIINRLFDHDNQQVTAAEEIISCRPGIKNNCSSALGKILSPHLWSPETPYLYRLVTAVTDAATGKVLDQLANAVGFRWFSFDADKGFLLNGAPYKLIGTNRHQDYKGMANALPDAMHVNDMRLLKDMGANFIRISHYPQDAALMEACDRMGLLASVEIPVVNRITEDEAFSRNCEYMLQEMIRQQYNHPSVIAWGYMNEVLLRPRYEKDTPEQERYFTRVYALARRLDSMARKEDPYRVTMMAMNGNFELYRRTGLATVPMVTGWNLYQGWYSEGIQRFGEYLDMAHAALPDKPILVTEYGADALLQLRTFSPVRFDKTIDYENYFHRVYLSEIEKRPFVAGAALWNLADFSAEERAEAMPHVNNKGLLAQDRTPKDVYYFYQARLLKTPFLKIGSGSWKLRSGVAGAGELFCVQPVEVYTNLPEVELLLNGRLIGKVRTEQGVAAFSVPFVNDRNQLEAIAYAGQQVCKDMAAIRFLLVAANLKDSFPRFEELNVSLGDRRYYTDDPLQQVWLPEQPYSKGSWGYIGGTVFTMKGVKRISYGSDKDILGTNYDAIYETQRVGIEGFRLDVPDGVYEITLHMCELLSGTKREVLANNLSNEKQQPQQAIERCFDIQINGHKIIENLGSHNYLVPDRAYAVKTKLFVANGNGIDIRFIPQKGETILNGLQVRKIY